MTEDVISDSDNEVNEAEHSNLLTAVTQLEGKQRVKPSTRKEPSLEVSEFHLVKSGTGKKDAVRVHELAQVLGKHSSHIDITQRIRTTKRQAKTLSKPAEKPEADRINRTVRYENVKQQLNRWDAVVHTNRLSDNLSFPLNQPSVHLQSSTEFLRKFKPQTHLEIEIAEILNEGKTVPAEKDDEESEFPMTLEEMVARRNELSKLRAKQWYHEAKAARQKKIKSKKYHRILRKEKIKEQLKEFEALKKTDPEAALQRLEQLDKSRAEERASLRHRSTGQWARNRAVRAKYDQESRQVLAQQLSISRELTQKVRKDGSSDDDEDDELPQNTSNSADNPWVDGGITTSAEVSEFVYGYQKYWDQKMKSKASKENDSAAEYSMDRVDKDEQFEDVELVEKERNYLDNGQEKIAKLSETETKTTAGEEQDDTLAAKTNSTKKSRLEVNGSGILRKKSSKRNIEPSTKHCRPILPVTNHIIGEEIEPEQKKKKSQRKSISKVLEGKKSKDKKVRATTSGWIVISTENLGTNHISKKKSKKSKISPMNMDELFDDIDKKFQDKLSKSMKNIKNKMNIKDVNHVRVKDAIEENDLGASLAFKKAASRPIIDEELSEGTNCRPSTVGDQVTVLTNSKENNQELTIRRDVPSTKNPAPDVDPNRFLAIKPKHLKTQLPDIVTAGEEALDDEAERHMTITEAFAEDDVVAEFRKEKEETTRASKLKDINLTLPGWGQWGGKDLPNRPMGRRKRKRLIIKKPIEPPRKDSNKGNVIINEQKDAKVKEHLVNALPFPFTSVTSFEASIRAPIGNTWVPETSFRKLTAPQVRTKLGAIIKPMDEDELLNSKNKSMNWN